MASSLSPSFDTVWDFGSLYQAHLLARRGKQGRREVAEFEMDLAGNLVQLSDALRDGTYRPLPYTRFVVHDPKRRVVHSLRYRDRVVQHALCDNVLAPVIEPRLVYDNAACRVGKGTHFALDRLSTFLCEHWRMHGVGGGVLKLDVRKFFASVDHAVLRRKLARLPFDRQTFDLIDILIDGFPVEQDGGAGQPRGLPLGNQSSQWFALYYLDGLDRLVKETMRVRACTRYMDDAVLVHADRGVLRGALERIRAYMQDELLLELNDKTQITPLAQGIDYLGMHLYLTQSGKVVRRLRQKAKRRLKRSVRETRTMVAAGTIEPGKALESFQSHRAHLSHAHAHGLMTSIDWSVALASPTTVWGSRARGRGLWLLDFRDDMMSYHLDWSRMSTVGVHPRITRRHPEVTDEDVIAAMRGMIRYKQRLSGEWVAVGLDGRNRLVELVYQYDAEEDFFFVFHGMTPPSAKTLRELGLER